MAITINGTTGIAGVDGSASTPAVQGSDTNTGVIFGTDTVSIVTGGSTRATVDSSGNFQYNSGYGSVATVYGCRAWVNFNGTGTVAIRASGNVTSITDNGTGDYTVNITNAMPDINYATVVTYSQDYGVARCMGAQLYLNSGTGAEVAPTTTAARIVTTTTTAAFDSKYVCVGIYR